MTEDTQYRGVKTLHFEDRHTDDVRIWGGISWPMLRGPVGSERVEGSACIVAESIVDRVCTVYEQTIWMTVEPASIPNRAVERGLANHLLEWYGRYRCANFCCVGKRDTERDTWEPQIRQSRMIQPQPQLREEHFDGEAAFAEIIGRAQASQFRHSAGESVDIALQAARNDRSDVAPPVMAVAAALRGIRSLGITLTHLAEGERKVPGPWARIFKQEDRR